MSDEKNSSSDPLSSSMPENERFDHFPTWEGDGDITELLQGEAGKVLHEYSQIEHEDMDSHVRRIVSLSSRDKQQAWPLSGSAR